MKYWKVESTTQKGKYYMVREYKGKLRCNCPKFVFTGSCKHTASIGLGLGVSPQESGEVQGEHISSMT